MDYAKALQLLPAKIRQRLYLGLGCVAALLTATGAVWLASPYDVPWWIAGGLAGCGVLAVPFAAVAAGNVNDDPPERAVLDGQGQVVYAEPVDPTQGDPEGRKIALTHGA